MKPNTYLIGNLSQGKMVIKNVMFSYSGGNEVNCYRFMTRDGLLGMATVNEVSNLQRVLSLKVALEQYIDIPL